MPNPKSKHTRHRTGIRRASNFKVTVASSVTCPNCGQPRWPHRACKACGFYNGRLVLTPKVEKPKAPQNPS